MDHIANLKTMVETHKLSGDNVLSLDSYSERLQVIHLININSKCLTTTAVYFYTFFYKYTGTLILLRISNS